MTTNQRTLLDSSLTKEQLAHELLGLGIHSDTADSLVGIVPAIRHILGERRRAPTMTAQREALDEMVAAAEAARVAFKRAWRLTDPAGLGMALRERLDDASDDRAHEGLDALLGSLAWASGTAKAARANMGTTQKRSRAATTPIRLIHERLKLAPSTSSEGRFRKVAVLLYRAAGYPFANPDAAIRAYAKALDSR